MIKLTKLAFAVSLGLVSTLAAAQTELNVWEDIQKYNNMGYKYFKFEGRTLPSADIFSNYLYYLFKPEYIPVIVSKSSYVPGIFFNNPNSQFYLDMVKRTDASLEADNGVYANECVMSWPF